MKLSPPSSTSPSTSILPQASSNQPSNRRSPLRRAWRIFKFTLLGVFGCFCLLVVAVIIFPPPPESPAKAAAPAPEPPAQNSPYAPADPLPSVPVLQAGPLDERFAKEADVYINGCAFTDLKPARCAEMIAEFKRDYVAARRGSHPAMRAVAAALSVGLKNYTIFNTPYEMNMFQGCAWALAAHIGVPDETDGGDPNLVAIACNWATTPLARRLASRRAETLIDEARHPTHLPPEIRFPAAGSNAARLADASARRQASLYIEGCADYGGDDKKLCDLDVAQFTDSYRRAMANDKFDGIENLVSYLSGDGIYDKGIATDHLESCAWAVVSTDRDSAQTDSSEALALADRCAALTDDQKTVAIARARGLVREIEIHPNAPPPDDP
jgi:hypothetical protein